MMEAEQRRRRYQWRREHHICTRCGQQDERTLAGYACCSVCNAKQQARKAQKWRESGETRQAGHDAFVRMRERRKAEGLCVKCGKAPARAGKTLCKKCADSQRIAQSGYNKRATAGKLTACPYAVGLEDLGEYACLHCPRPNTCIYDELDYKRRMINGD